MRWASPDAVQPEVMKLPPGTLGGRAIDIAEDGTIAVRLSTRTYIEQTYLWFPDGTSRPIEAPKAGKGQATRFWSAYFRFGWLYGDVATFAPAGTASSGPSAASARCHARRSGSAPGSVTSASAACTRRRSPGDAPQ